MVFELVERNYQRARGDFAFVEIFKELIGKVGESGGNGGVARFVYRFLCYA